jgi:threonine aldolase
MTGSMSEPRFDFRSDNTGAAAPEIVAALAAANNGTAAGYGNDVWTGRLQTRFSDLFETKVRVFPVATGTAANAITLAALSPSYGAVYCSANAHVDTSECNATAFFGGGTKLVPIPGPNGKVTADSLRAAIEGAGIGLAHKSQPAAVNVTQATDLGAVYGVDEVAAIGAVAKRHGLKVHMDGARFGNALARLGCAPADVTWKAGVDVLSFGATKNGGALTDAIVVFTPNVAEVLHFHLRRAGQVWSKMRFAAVQLLAYVEDDLWLRLARQANAAAARIAARVAMLPTMRLVAPVEANEIFLELPAEAMDALEREGVGFFRRGPTLARFVCRWDTTEAEIEALCGTLERHYAARKMG